MAAAGRQEFKFSFSESGLQGYITDLRRLNKTFFTTSNQVVRLKNQSSSSLLDPVQDRYVTKVRRETGKFRLVRPASQQLYEVLGQACSLHAEHLAQLCLGATCTNVSEHITSYEVCFNLAFTHDGWKARTHLPFSTFPSPTEPPTTVCASSEQMDVPRAARTFSSSAFKNTSETPSIVSICELTWFEIQTIVSN